MARKIGTNLADRIAGTNLSDWLSGLGGNDTILGHGGNDQIHGGDGNDALYGGAGLDRVLLARPAGAEPLARLLHAGDSHRVLRGDQRVVRVIRDHMPGTARR